MLLFGLFDKYLSQVDDVQKVQILKLFRNKVVHSREIGQHRRQILVNFQILPDQRAENNRIRGSRHSRDYLEQP